MPDLQLSLSTQEHEYLAGLLETVLKDMRVEEHRTRTPSFRAHILHQEDLIKALLTKLGKPAA